MPKSLNPTSNATRTTYGDFPTPRGLVAKILDALQSIGDFPDRVLEPTSGEGRFIAGFLERSRRPAEIRAFEVQAGHAEIARSLADFEGRTLVTVETADLFTIDLRTDLQWVTAGPLLVVGNLPWVTTSALGASGGKNGPSRTNHRRLRGMDAMTGESNFDISEAIWLKLIRELAHEQPTIALLCKTAVARTILREIHRSNLPITSATLWRIDAKHWFRAAVDACLLRVEVGLGPRATEANVFADLSQNEPEATLGLDGDRLIADIKTYRQVAFADSPCPLQWRQGIKHDATSIMELSRRADGTFTNKLGESVDVEAEFVFPLLKGTDLAGSRQVRPPRWVIVTQTGLSDDTRNLERTAPKLWSYLSDHSEAFEARKSSIYRGRPPFAMFGVGDYSFGPFKVAISGLHKDPRFRLVAAVAGRPTMVDDTCYFLPCWTLEQASLLERILNGRPAIDLLRSLIFRDSKRPVTKALLQRIGLKSLLEGEGLIELWRPEWESDWTKPARRSSTD